MCRTSKLEVGSWKFLELNLDLEPFGTHSEMCSNTPNGNLEIPSQNLRMVIWKFQVQIGRSTHGIDYHLSKNESGE